MNDLIFKMLKLIESGIEPRHIDLGVEFQEFAAAAEKIKDDYLATNVGLARGGRGNPILTVHMNGSELTHLGKSFIARY